MSAHAGESNGKHDTNTPVPQLPALAAVFLVKFDDRKGYTVAWQRSVDGLNVEGAVEFKCLPSGLHNVEEDLVYFVHDDYAGVSASLNVKDEEAARKARVLAVGVLVPLEHGRMGKSWLHAERVKELAKEQVTDVDEFSGLERYWEEHRLSRSPQVEEPLESPTKPGLNIDTTVGGKPTGYHLPRSMSTGTVSPVVHHVLPNHHPALVLPELIRVFGPLIFPLIRAALLRKRILLLGEAPVEKTCNYVYNISILSSLPRPITAFLPSTDPERLRLRPLFNIGVADIPLLESETRSAGGWVACTTDDVLCTKPELFDVLVILPDVTKLRSDPRAYPRLYPSGPELRKAYPRHGLRASQRDAKRFATLWKGSQSIPRAVRESNSESNSSAVLSVDESITELPEDENRIERVSTSSSVSSTLSMKSVVEPQSWSRIAYTSLIWWASAGDKRGGLTEMEENEDEQDVALLTGEGLDESDDGLDEAQTREVACVAYFHRLTNMMFTAADEVIRRTDGYGQRYTDEEPIGPASFVEDRGEDEGDDQALLPDGSRSNDQDSEPTIEITDDDIQNMGLDVWSASDRGFVVELVQTWWSRKAVIQSGRIECCGVRFL